MHFRIIRDQAHEGLFNMQADRYLLSLAEQSDSFILRTYSWIAPTITLGCMQNAAELLDSIAMRSAGVESISRPTGGRAVLHWNDVTYSCAFPASGALMGRNIADTYAVISRCLAAGLLMAGIDCGMHSSDAEYHATHRNLRLPCFLSPNRSELMADDRKLVGSAQKRTSRAVLQHGSIPLDASFRRIADLLCASPEDKVALRILLEKNCVCACEIVPTLDRETLADCLIKGFIAMMPFDAGESEWSETELREIVYAR